MDLIRNAWRLLDGSYRLTTHFNSGNDEYSRRSVAEATETIRKAGGRWDAGSGAWIVPEAAVDLLGVERVFVVVAAGYCCRGPSRAEARAYQVRRRAIFRVFCESCGKRPRNATLWEVPIIESCGEGEEGQMTYETAFRTEIEGR
jgi:hypothetical protein